MTDQFAPFLEDKRKAAIIAVAMSLGVLLLLPANLGFGSRGTIMIQEAFGQFNLPLPEEEEAEEGGSIVVGEEEEEETTTTPTPTTSPPAVTDTIQDLSTYLISDVNVDSVYGFIGSSLLAAQGAGSNATLTSDDGSGHVVTGLFRLFANRSFVERFVAEMKIAAVDGSSYHNITIEDGFPDRYDVTEGNGTTATVPAVSSNIVGHIYLNGGTTPVVNNVPMTLTVRGQVLAIEDIDIDETRITDPAQREILSILDEQTIYGTRPRR
jgi:hypothetical protein